MSSNKNTNPPCPYCGGPMVKKGFKKGKQCYVCKECGKWCTGEHPEPTIYFKDINTTVSCPHCNSMNISTSGFSNKGLRVYRCLSCRRRFTEETKERISKGRKYASEVCPRCGGKKIVSAGLSRGKQRFRCLDCRRTYTKGAKLMTQDLKRKPVLSTADKRKVLMFRLNLGLSIPELSKHFNCSQYSIRQLVKEYYSNNAKQSPELSKKTLKMFERGW